MGHKFHVKRHFKFEVEDGAKPWSMLACTVHRRRESLQLGFLFMQHMLLKTPISLCKSCRGSSDLQLYYTHLVALMLQNVEKFSVKHS
jgi:hypothetical protein